MRSSADMPEGFAGRTCGAKTKRSGQPCKSGAIYTNGRCKFHGGLSTGPKTEAGREASRRNGKLGGRPRKIAAITQEAKPLDDAPLVRCAECDHLVGSEHLHGGICQ